jgi:hypothetical protein
MAKDDASTSWKVSQSSAAPAFQIILFPETFVSKVAKNSYREKHPEKVRESIDKNWKDTEDQAQQAGKEAPFNGPKAILYARPGKEYARSGKEGVATVKVLSGNYAGFLASIKAKDVVGDPEAGMRKHFPTGVIIVCVTKDGHAIMGSRDANWHKDKPETLMAQFPAGFIDTDADFYKKVATPKGLDDVFKATALKELREEVLNFPDDKVRETRVLGGVMQTKKWPSKKTEMKEIANFKSVVVQVHVDMSAEEILKRRKELFDMPPEAAKNQSDYPQDGKKEMSVATSMKLSDVMNMHNAPQVELEGRQCKFVAEHAVVPAVIDAAAKKNEKTGRVV